MFLIEMSKLTSSDHPSNKKFIENQFKRISQHILP